MTNDITEHGPGQARRWLYTLLAGISLLVSVSVPSLGQIQIDELSWPSTIVEPSQQTDAFQTVFRFRLRDVDPVRNDRFDPYIHCIHIKNLGSAREDPEIKEIKLRNETTGEEIVRLTQRPGQIGKVTDDCPPSAPANSSVAFEAFFSRDDLPDTQSGAFQLDDVELGQFGDPKTFAVQVRVGDHQRLGSRANNHTLRLQATVRFEEPRNNDGDKKMNGDPKIGEDPEDGEDNDGDGKIDEDGPYGPASTVSVTDSVVDRLQNRGINSAKIFNLSSQHVIPIPDPEEGDMSVQSAPVTVAAFTLCDGDHRIRGAGAGNTELLHPDADQDDEAGRITITKVIVKQGPTGSATEQDIAELTVVDQDGNELRSASPLPPPDDPDEPKLSRAGPGVELTDGDLLTIDNNACRFFELRATAKDTATRGRTVQPVITVVAEENGITFDGDLAVTLSALDTTMLGSGILRLQNRSIPLRTNPEDGPAFPVKFQGVLLERGFGRLQIQTRSIQFNPDLIQIDRVEGANGVAVQTDSVKIDSREGALRFTLQGPASEASGRIVDLAKIWVKPKGGEVGDRSPLLLQVDQVINGDDEDITRQVVLSSGSVTLVNRGDVNLDSQLTVADLLALANVIVEYCGDPGSEIPSEVMKLEQKLAANVAGDSPEDIESAEWCNFLDSSDVKEIAKMIVGQDGSQLASSRQSDRGQPRPWWASLVDRLLGRSSGDKAAELTFSQRTGHDGTWTLQALDLPAPIGGLQGRIQFDPDRLDVPSIEGVNGYEVLASYVEPQRGEVRFVALAPHGGRAGTHGILKVDARAEQPGSAPQLILDHLVDANGAPLDVRLDAPRSITPLSVSTLEIRRPELDRWTLEVRGQGVESVAVQGYDLGGQRRFHESAQGSQLEWRALDERTGRRLANGVYLYRVTVEGVNGEIWRSDVRKLVVLR